MIRTCPNCTVCHCVLTPEQKRPGIINMPVSAQTQQEVNLLRSIIEAVAKVESQQLTLF